MKKTLLLTVAIAWMGIGNVWNESVIAQEEAVPVSATESEEGAIRKTTRLQKELDDKKVEVAVLRERLKVIETMLQAQMEDAKRSDLRAAEQASRIRQQYEKDRAREADARVRATEAAARATDAERKALARIPRVEETNRVRNAENPLRTPRTPRPVAPPRRVPQGAPPGVPKEAPVSPGHPPRPSSGVSSPYATEAESHPGTPSDPASPQMLAIDQVIDRAAALRKQAIRAKLRGYEDEARRLWLQAEDASKEIEQHMRARHPGVQPLGLGSSPPRQPPAPDAVPRKLRRVTPTEARPGVRSAAPGSKPRKLRRVTPSTEARPVVRSAAPGSKPRKLRRVTPREVSPEPRVRSARPENSRTHASGKEVWEEIEHLRGEVRELRELLKKALRERKTRASFAF